METSMVRQPILDRNNLVIGYEILYQEDVTSLYSEKDSTMAHAIEDFLLELDSDKFLDGKTAYLTFTPNLLIKNIPKMFQLDRLVIQIEDNSIVHPLAQKIIYRYKKQGYRIAIKNFEFSPRFFGMLDVVDIIKIDFSDPHNTSLANVVSLGHSLKKDIIAFNVNTNESYEKAMECGCEYLQGSCVAEQFASKIHRMDHLQSNFFQLMIAITKDEPDIDEIAAIISRDVTLAFSLMKLVNSAYFALRNRVKSVKQALIVLGLGQLKQWVYLLSFKQDDGNIPEELIKISFLRASFCEELCDYAQDMPISKAEAYLIGMFSTLGTLLQVPIEDAIKELNLSEEIKTALVTGEGQCGTLYHLVLSYEKADWRSMTQCANRLGIPINVITQKYFECVEQVNSIWKDLTSPGENAETETAETETESKPTAPQA